MKKIILSVVFCLAIIYFDSVNASSVDYNLTMDSENKCHETVIYNIEKNTTSSYLKEILNDNVYFDINNTTLYDKKISNVDNNVVVTLYNDYSCNQIVNSKLINKCFKNVYLEKDKTETYFSANSPFDCANIVDQISISLETDVNIIDSNALKDDNKYTWDEIDEDLYISVEMGKPNIDVADNQFPYVPVVASLACLAVIVLVMIRIKNTKSDNSFYDY